MRRTLGPPALVLATLLTLGLSACGQDADDTATDPVGEATSQSGEPTDQPTPETEDDGPVPFTQVALLTNTEEDGTVSTTPAPLDTEAAVAEFTDQFTGSRMAEDIRTAVSSAPDIGADQTLVGAVLVIGCDRPIDVTVERVDGAVQVSPVMSKRQVQCFAAQTSVAILVVDTVELGPTVS
ncbi:hypothetical protein [Nocardioides sp. InS609-2]|uniref:hypothetical protein n=1 Tax=Nocardioides sp. InS609-2 TaxID=2760705 RepID=UPI0020C0FBCD|nr:hypothetical protein [Nocardioides sp. InS609-2]